jgi:hypothetical protein
MLNIQEKTMSSRIISPLSAMEAAPLRQALRGTFNASEIPLITWGPIPGTRGGPGEYQVEIVLGTICAYEIEGAVRMHQNLKGGRSTAPLHQGMART